MGNQGDVRHHVVLSMACVPCPGLTGASHCQAGETAEAHWKLLTAIADCQKLRLTRCVCCHVVERAPSENFAFVMTAWVCLPLSVMYCCWLALCVSLFLLSLSLTRAQPRR